ncbi:hypothetical protein HanPSC8_Chr17g0758471 [Helianthus annuus]|nr:hypothetical protein HanPSC8_Chr17g0758471 [Helianthus annuus]
MGQFWISHLVENEQGDKFYQAKQLLHAPPKWATPKKKRKEKLFIRIGRKQNKR